MTDPAAPDLAIVERLKADAEYLRDAFGPSGLPDRADEAAQCIEMLVEALEVFARCPTHGKHGGPFVIASASFEDMCTGESAPREAYWHKSDFDKARDAIAKVRGR